MQLLSTPAALNLLLTWGGREDTLHFYVKLREENQKHLGDVQKLDAGFTNSFWCFIRLN